MSKIATNRTKLNRKIEELEKKSQLIRYELENEIELSKDKVADVLKLILGIGGGILFSTIILSGLIRRKSKNPENRKSKKVYHRFRDQLTHELTGQATDFLIGLVKDRLSAYIDKKENGEDDDSEITG